MVELLKLRTIVQKRNNCKKCKHEVTLKVTCIPLHHPPRIRKAVLVFISTIKVMSVWIKCEE